jgi:hypothetical protein
MVLKWFRWFFCVQAWRPLPPTPQDCPKTDTLQTRMALRRAQTGRDALIRSPQTTSWRVQDAEEGLKVGQGSPKIPPRRPQAKTAPRRLRRPLDEPKTSKRSDALADAAWYLQRKPENVQFRLE